MRQTTMYLLLAFAAAAGGCSASPDSIERWTGYVVPQALQTDPRGKDVRIYQAACLRIVEGPEILPVDRVKVGKHAGPATRILVDEEDRILDPTAFGPAGLVRVEGISTGLWGATDAEGRWLYYSPPRREIDWVEQVIRVKGAWDAGGRVVQLKYAVPTAAPR